MISVDELRVDYGNFCAVEELSFTVSEGEVFGLIGPNGAGKTSTMRALVGLLTPTYGAINIARFDIREEPQAVGQLLGFPSASQKKETGSLAACRQISRNVSWSIGIALADRCRSISCYALWSCPC